MAKNQKRSRVSAPRSRWTTMGEKTPPLDVLIDVRHGPGLAVEQWRCVEVRSRGIYSMVSVCPGGGRWYTSMYDFMQWRFPDGRGMTEEQIANVQRAMKARRTRLKKLEDAARELKAKRDLAGLKRRLAQQALDAQLPVYRIRRYSGCAGGSNHYHHADVIAVDRREALRAAKENRVVNWRWIDTYDTSDVDYCRYEYLYQLTQREAKRPAKPLTKTEAARREREWRARQRQADGKKRR